MSFTGKWKYTGKALLLSLGTIILIASCKPSQRISGLSVTQDTTSLATKEKTDTSFFITQNGDTLDELFTEVEIEVHRLIKDTISLAAVGDIMMGTNFPDPSYLPPDNGSVLWAKVRDTLQSADLTFGNLEGVILDEGGEPKNCKNPEVCYLFRTPVRFTPNLVTAGFDFMSLANNHTGDFGEPGRHSTVSTLDSLGIVHAGQLLQPYTVFEKDHMRIGFAAFSPNYGTLSINDLEAAQKIVQGLDSISDFVVVSFHGGAEGSKHERLTRKTEVFYGENRGNVYEFAHGLIDHGADIVLGHGPHVARAIEVYQNRFIAYSLGNFITYARFNLRGPNGLAPIVYINIDPEGRFLNGHIISAHQKPPGGAELDPEHRAALKIKELTELDIPENPVFIDANGQIDYKPEQ